MRVKQLIERISKCDPEKPVLFRTLDNDFDFHPGAPFEEDVIVHGDEVLGGSLSVILCSNESGD